MLIGILTVIPWIIGMVCVIQDMEAVQNAFLPSLEVFYQATGSKAVASFLQAYLTLLYYSTTSMMLVASSKHTLTLIYLSSLHPQPMDHLQSDCLGLFARCMLLFSTSSVNRE